MTTPLPNSNDSSYRKSIQSDENHDDATSNHTPNISDFPFTSSNQVAVVTPEKLQSQDKTNTDKTCNAAAGQSNPNTHDTSFNSLSSEDIQRAVTEAEEILKKQFTFTFKSKNAHKHRPLPGLPMPANLTSIEEEEGIAEDSSVSEMTEQSFMEQRCTTRGNLHEQEMFRTDPLALSEGVEEKKEDTNDRCNGRTMHNFPDLPESSDTYINCILQSHSFSSQLSEDSHSEAGNSEDTLSITNIGTNETLQQKLEKAQRKYRDERSKRRTKEEHVVKLAKELHRKQSENEMRNHQVAQLTDKVVHLEPRLNALHKELNHRIALHDKMKSEHTFQMDEAQQNYRRVCRQHDAAMKEIKNQNAKEMRQAKAREQELLKAHEFEVQRLNQEIQTMQKDLEQRRDQFKKVNSREQVPRKKKSQGLCKLFAFVFLVVSICIFSTMAVTNMGNQEFRETILDLSCAPVRPWTRFGLDSEGGSFDAPWLVPLDQATKARVFSAVCGSRQRSRVTWNPKSNSKGRGELLVSSLEGKDVTERPKVLKRQFAISAEIWPHHMIFVHKKGKGERLEVF